MFSCYQQHYLELNKAFMLFSLNLFIVSSSGILSAFYCAYILIKLAQSVFFLKFQIRN